MVSIPIFGPPVPGSNLGPGPPHSVVWGATDHTIILYNYSNVRKPQASVGCNKRRRKNDVTNLLQFGNYVTILVSLWFPLFLFWFSWLSITINSYCCFCLYQEKGTVEKNHIMVADFKTLADVLIQVGTGILKHHKYPYELVFLKIRRPLRTVFLKWQCHEIFCPKFVLVKLTYMGPWFMC